MWLTASSIWRKEASSAVIVFMRSLPVDDDQKGTSRRRRGL
jgi:hypothetical protein